MHTKKAQIDSMDVLLIIAVTTAIIIIFAVMLVNAGSIRIDDRHSQIQKIEKIIFTQKCFGEEYGEVQEDKFNEEQLNNCFKGMKKTTQFKISLNSKELYFNTESSEFNRKKSLCEWDSANTQCEFLVYPITYLESNKVQNQNTLVLEAISQN